VKKNQVLVVASIGLFSFCGLASAQDSAGSPGEAAKQSPPAAKAKIVLTDDNLQRGPVVMNQSSAAPNDDTAMAKPSADPTTDTSGADGAKAPESDESPEHVAARKTVEQFQSVIAREEKAGKEAEEGLSGAQTDAERQRMQAALDAHREHVRTLSDDLRDAEDELKRTPFSSKAATSSSDPQ
jgi:hypothetical protein